MSTVLLVGVDPKLSRGLRDASGVFAWEVREVSSADQLREEAASHSISVAVADSRTALDDLSRNLKSHDYALIVCTSPTTLADLKRAVLFTPYLPSDVALRPASDPLSIAEEIQSAAERVQKRQGLKRTFAQANALLANSAPQERGQFNYVDRLLEAAPIGVVAASVNGRVLSANRRASSLLGIDRIEGSSILDLLDEGARASIRNCIAETAGSAAEPARCRIKLRGRLRFIHLDLSIARFEQMSGEPGILLIFQDISAQVRAEQARDRLLQRERRISADLAESQQHLRLALLAGRMGTWRWDAGTNRVDWSESLERLYGLRPGEFAGTFDAFLSFVHPGDRPFVTEKIGRAGESGDEYEIEFRAIRADGEVRWIADRGLVLRDESGRRTGMTGVCWDNTERHLAEAEIASALERERQARAEAQAAERRAAFLADAAAALSSSLDYNATLGTVARMAVPRIADWCAVDMVNADGSTSRVAIEHVQPEKRELALELHRRYPPRAADILGRVLRTGRSELMPEITDETITSAAYDAEHLRILRQLGLRSYVVVPIRRGDDVTGVISLFSAESGYTYGPADLRLAEELADRAAVAVENARLYAAAEEGRAEAERAAEELRRMNTELEQFAFVASHDLQEPLRTVGSYAQLLARLYRGRLDKDADEFIGYITDGVKRMRTLIDDLLTYSRVTRADTQAAETVNMEAVLAEAMQSLSAAISENAAEITHDRLPDLPRAHPRQMQQVIQNLLSNAIKYRRAEEPPRVHVSAAREDNKWHFRVADNGQGFNPEYADQIFGIFKRLHGKDVPGTGIGLALCQRIIERHGGRIWAEAEPGKGATFHFTIPAVPAAQAA